MSTELSQRQHRRLVLVGVPALEVRWDLDNSTSFHAASSTTSLPRVSSNDAGSTYGLLRSAPSNHEDLQHLWFVTNAGSIRHPPFELEARAAGPNQRVLLTVQHVKRSPIFGVIRYTERLSAQGVVDRTLGITPGADVIVENTVERSLLALGGLDAVDVGFGGARVRGRSQGAMVSLAGIYSDVIRPQLAPSAAALLGLALILSDLSRPGVWSDLANSMSTLSKPPE